MTTDTMLWWLRNIVGPNHDDVPRLVVLDQASVHKAHATRDKMEEMECDVVFIPAGCTFFLQPADVSWNAPFKAAMREEWKRWRARGLHTPAGNLQVQYFQTFRAMPLYPA